MGDVLVNDPQTIVIDGENERLVQLAQRLQRRKGGGLVDEGSGVIGNWRSATVGNWFWLQPDERLSRKACDGNGGICLYFDAFREMKSFSDDRLQLRLQPKSL